MAMSREVWVKGGEFVQMMERCEEGNEYWIPFQNGVLITLFAILSQVQYLARLVQTETSHAWMQTTLAMGGYLGLLASISKEVGFDLHHETRQKYLPK